MKDEKQSDFSKACYDLAHVTAINSLNYLVSTAEKEGNAGAMGFLELAKLSLETALKVLEVNKGNNEVV